MEEQNMVYPYNEILSSLTREILIQCNTDESWRYDTEWNKPTSYTTPSYTYIQIPDMPKSMWKDKRDNLAEEIKIYAHVSQYLFSMSFLKATHLFHLL